MRFLGLSSQTGTRERLSQFLIGAWDFRRRGCPLAHRRFLREFITVNGTSSGAPRPPAAAVEAEPPSASPPKQVLGTALRAWAPRLSVNVGFDTGV